MTNRPTNQPNNKRSVRTTEQPTSTLHLPNQPIEMPAKHKSNQASTTTTKHSRLFVIHHQSLSSPHVLESKGKLRCPFNVTQPTDPLSYHAALRNIIILKTNTINCTNKYQQHCTRIYSFNSSSMFRSTSTILREN